MFANEFGSATQILYIGPSLDNDCVERKRFKTKRFTEVYCKLR